MVTATEIAVTLALWIGKDEHSRGREGAPLTLVEYGDYECIYCGRPMRS